ncbi:Fc.00g021930.m01.CDS01 [Cosmosporella sp. VM-42]
MESLKSPGSVSWPQGSHSPWKSCPNSNDFPRNIAYIHKLKIDPDLQPTKYEINGTHPETRILFVGVRILDSTGREPYLGDVLIEGEKITAVGDVPQKENLVRDPKVRVFQGKGRTLMSGLGDGHTHLTWNGGGLARLGELKTEENVLLTLKSAHCFLDSGYTMCFGAASAKDRLDVVVRDAINAGGVPGPGYLANAKEIAKSEGDLVAGITAFPQGPDQIREVVRYHIQDIGVDNVKLSMSGEEICEVRSAEECFFTDEETAACVDEAHKYKKRLCAHARARDSIKMCLNHGVDVIYHGSYIDDEGTSTLSSLRLNWLWVTTYEAEAFSYSQEKAEKVGYKRELDVAVAGLREMHRRGIVILPGGDYGFAWTPNGTYSRDLEHVVRLLGFTPHESVIAATAGVAALLMRGHELGRIQPGYYADCVLVDGDPLEDISILQDHNRLNIIINGRVHKAGRNEHAQYSAEGISGTVSAHVVMDFPEVGSIEGDIDAPIYCGSVGGPVAGSSCSNSAAVNETSCELR